MNLKAYKIADAFGISVCLEPVCYEDCMNPGEVKVIPVQKEESADKIILSVAGRVQVIEKAQLESGRQELQEYEFTPKLPRYEGKRCSPCTGCGACSW